ncbi:MAG: FimB/Mfa2 family fimbrial subunit [Bacteroides sp.]|nr:FimB/Mfa2 family fimbrial subunit [Bacteroides sp.]
MDRNRCAGWLVVRTWLLMFLVASCVYDGRSDCPPGHSRVRIYFSYPSLSLSGYDGIDPSEAWRADVFVFDEEGLFVSRLSEEEIVLDGAFYIEAVLPDGEYQLVSWFNLHEHYTTRPETFVAGETTLTEARIALSALEDVDHVVDYPLHTLLYGSLENVSVGADAMVFSDTGDYQPVVVPLRQDTYQLRFTLRGLDAADAAYTLTVTDDNGCYYFDNSFAPGRELHYISSACSDGSGDMEATMTVLRLDHERAPVIGLTPGTESGEVLYESDLMDLILDLERTYGIRIDFSVTYRFDIVIEFTENADGSLNAEVSINGWKQIDEGGEIG